MNRLKVVRLNENLPPNVLAGKTYTLPLVVLDGKKKVLCSSNDPYIVDKGKSVASDFNRILDDCSVVVKTKNNKIATNVSTAQVDRSCPMKGFRVTFGETSVEQEFHISMQFKLESETLDTSACLPGVVVKSYKYLLQVTECDSKGTTLLSDNCENWKDADERDVLGLKYPNLTWYKDERGRESNYIECKLDVVDSKGAVQSTGVGTKGIETKMFYCREESINKGKGNVVGKKPTITGGSGSGGNLDEWGDLGGCFRSDHYTEVADQAILNILAKGRAESGGALFARFRIEEVSKNHQANFFRISLGTDSTFKGFKIGDGHTRRIYVKSKRSKTIAEKEAAKGRRVAASGGVNLPMPPAYLMKASIETIQAAHIQAITTLQEYRKAGTSSRQLDTRCHQVMNDFNTSVSGAYKYMMDCISAIDVASQPVRYTNAAERNTVAAPAAKNPAKNKRNSSSGSSASSKKAKKELMGGLDMYAPMESPPPAAPSLRNQQSLSMNLSLFNEIMEQGGEYGMQPVTALPVQPPISETQPYDPNSDQPPPQNPDLSTKVSSHYIGPGKDLRRTETTNIMSTLSQFPSTELAMGATVPPKTQVGTSTDIQRSVYYILAKLWCGDPGEHGNNAVAYGFPAFDNMFNVLGFYREVYDTEGGAEEQGGEELNNAIGVFIPITDSRELGKKQRGEMTAKLKKEIRAKSASVCKLSDCEGKLEILIAEGFTYVWTKMMNSGGQSMSLNMSGSWW